jgi:hypothetical protein
MHPREFDRSTLVGGAYHEVDSRICYVLVNFTQESIDASWGEFCGEMGWVAKEDCVDAYGRPLKPVKRSWWRRALRK